MINKNFVKIKLNQKGFAPIIIILGIVLILGIAGGVYLFGKNTNTAIKNNPVIIPTPTPTPTSTPTITPKIDETANWKTYKNETYLFEFRYPPSWYSASPDLFPDTIFFSSSAINFPKNAGGPVTPIMISILKDSNIQKEVDSYKEAYHYVNFKDEAVLVGGISGRKISGIAREDSYAPIAGKMSVEVFIPKNNVVIKISYVEVDDVKTNILDQILSTFKFSEPNLGSGIYTCPENGHQNCMPILDVEGQKQCTKEALDWKKANCPNFTGAAY